MIEFDKELEEAIYIATAKKLSYHQQFELLRLFMEGYAEVTPYPTLNVLYKAGLVDTSDNYPYEPYARHKLWSNHFLTTTGYMVALKMLSPEFHAYTAFYYIRKYHEEEIARKKWLKERRLASKLGIVDLFD